MNKKKEIQRRYGSNMSDAQYLAVGSALDDLQEHIIDKACEWLKEQSMSKYISVLTFGSCSVSFDTNSLMEAFRKAMQNE